jgi:hypothetical protein
MTEKTFNLEASIQRGIEATGLTTEVFTDKYSQKIKVLKDGKVKPMTYRTKEGEEKILTVEEMAVNQVISCEKAASKGVTEVLMHIESQDPVALTKTNRPYSNIYIVVPVGNNKELFHDEPQVEGCVKVKATHWSDKSFRPGFYRAKLSKKMNEWNGRMIANYKLDDIGTTERTFTVPENMGEGKATAFRVLSAFEAKPVMSTKKDADGEGMKDEEGNWIREPRFRNKNGIQEPLMSRSMELLIQNPDGTKSVRMVSTVFDEWMGIQIDPSQTYKGILRENGVYLNLNSVPIKSNEKIEMDDSVLCDVLADLSDLRAHIGKFVKLRPMFGDAPVEGKENPEKKTKISYTTITDMSATSVTIIGDPSVFDSVIDKTGKMAGIVQVIGRVNHNKKTDSVSIWTYLITDISKGMPSEPIKIDESRGAKKASVAENSTTDAW